MKKKRNEKIESLVKNCHHKKIYDTVRSFDFYTLEELEIIRTVYIKRIRHLEELKTQIDEEPLGYPITNEIKELKGILKRLNDYIHMAEIHNDLIREIYREQDEKEQIERENAYYDEEEEEVSEDDWNEGY